MNLYDELTPKQRRTITRDINVIFSFKNFLFPKTIEEIKEIGFFSPKIRVNSGEVYFLENGKKSLGRICDFVHQSKKFQNLLNYDDIFQSVLSEIERWISDGFIPNTIEFIGPLEKLLSGKIKRYFFVCRVEGISFGNISNLNIGNRQIKVYDNSMLLDLSGCKDNFKKAIDKSFLNNLIIMGAEQGSAQVSEEKFFHNTELSLSVLRLYACATLEGAIHRIDIHLIKNCGESFIPVGSFGWTEPGKNLFIHQYGKFKSDFKIDNESLTYMKEKCFFEKIFSLINKNNKNNLEHSIVKSIYWIGEAQKDSSHSSAWVKLWSCLECFFTLEKDEITESNARGISSILVYGGYSHKNFDEYDQVKKKIKKYYVLRSKIVHHAEYSQIDKLLLSELSYIVAWVIITVVSLLGRNYTTLAELHEQAKRLDRIHKKDSSMS